MDLLKNKILEELITEQNLLHLIIKDNLGTLNKNGILELSDKEFKNVYDNIETQIYNNISNSNHKINFSKNNNFIWDKIEKTGKSIDFKRELISELKYTLINSYIDQYPKYQKIIESDDFSDALDILYHVDFIENFTLLKKVTNKISKNYKKNKTR